jgi:hypothetical protein
LVVVGGLAIFGLSRWSGSEAGAPSTEGEAHAPASQVSGNASASPEPSAAVEPPAPVAASIAAPSAEPANTPAPPSASVAPPSEPEASERTSFSEANVRDEITRLLENPDSCRDSGQPAGWVYLSVVVTLEGKIGRAGVTNAPYARTATATCLTERIEALTLTPFFGGTRTVAVSLELH